MSEFHLNNTRSPWTASRRGLLALRAAAAVLEKKVSGSVVMVLFFGKLVPVVYSCSGNNRRAAHGIFELLSGEQKEKKQ